MVDWRDHLIRVQLYFSDAEIEKMNEIGCKNYTAGAKAMILLKMAEIYHDPALQGRGIKALLKAQYPNPRLKRRSE